MKYLSILSDYSVKTRIQDGRRRHLEFEGHFVKCEKIAFQSDDAGHVLDNNQQSNFCPKELYTDI